MERFGQTATGTEIHRLTIADGALEVGLLTLGAILHEVRLGQGPSYAAGSARIADYLTGDLGYCGAVVGPVANRIGGAEAELDGAALRLEPNEPTPPGGDRVHAPSGGNHLHGGSTGLHTKVWQIADQSPSHVSLTCAAVDGEGGLPGNRRFTATYRVTGDRLSLVLGAETDQPTYLAPANHAYWTLGETNLGLRLRLDAAQYLPIDAVTLPTGTVAPVAGTRFDFRAPRALTPADELDHCYVLGEAPGALRPVARLEAEGRWLEMETDAPGLQVFTAHPFTGRGPEGHDGRHYGPRFGIALEAEHWPDAPHNPSFPSIRLDPGQVWTQTSRWRFG